MGERKYFLDWIRVLAFAILIFFHCAMPFVIFGWEIKDSHQSVGLSRLIWWLHQWRLPLLFFISGVGIHFSLQKRNVFAFAVERVVRLLIPLLFAMFFTIPSQVYFEWLQKEKITGSYWDFYPSVWEMIPYPDGSLTWSHMWFVVYLFVFCMLLIPVFVLFQIGFIKRLRSQLANTLAHPVLAALLFLPLAFIYYSLYLEYPEQQSLLNDWFLFLYSLTLLLYGYLLAASERFWTNCERYRFHYLALAAACILVLFVKYWWNFNFPKQKDFSFYLYGTLNSMHIWLLVLAATGMAKRHLNVNSGFLRHANEAVYPFYILHQTIIVAIGYYLVQLDLPVLIKILILIPVVFILLYLIYRVLIRPFMLTRILYGMKPRRMKPFPKPGPESAL